MKEQAVTGVLGTTIEKMRQIVDVSTIIGEPIVTADGTTIIPVSKVTYGFASGGSDFPSKGTTELFGGGGGAGVTIQPVAFLVVSNGAVTVKKIASDENATEKAIGLIPEIFDKVTGLVEKSKKNKEMPSDDFNESIK